MKALRWLSSTQINDVYGRSLTTATMEKNPSRLLVSPVTESRGHLHSELAIYSGRGRSLTFPQRKF